MPVWSVSTQTSTLVLICVDHSDVMKIPLSMHLTGLFSLTTPKCVLPLPAPYPAHDIYIHTVTAEGDKTVKIYLNYEGRLVVLH